MKMKKFIASILALSLTLTTATAVFAEDITVSYPGSGAPNPEEEVPVTLTVDPTYLVTIPEKIELDPVLDDDNITVLSYAKEATISAEKVRIPSNKVVTVAIESNFELVEPVANEKLAYELKVGDSATAVKTGDIIATFETNTGTQTSDTLKFSADDPTYAGNYTDTVTFTISIADKPTTTTGTASTEPTGDAGSN